MGGKISRTLTLIVMLALLCVCSAPAQIQPKPATPITAARNAKVYGELDFTNRQDFEDASRGFIAGVPTHFPLSDDTVACAFRSAQAHCPGIMKMGDTLVWSFDTMVLRVFPDKIVQCRAVGNDFAFATPASVSYGGVQMYAPKYHTRTGNWDPWAQLDMSAFIPAIATNGTINYRPEGY